MTVEQLISELQNYEPDAEVRLAFQPSWPFEHSISEVTDGVASEPEVLQDDDGWYVEEDGEQIAGPFMTVADGEAWIERQYGNDDTQSVVYIAEGHQIGYLPGKASRALGWR